MHDVQNTRRSTSALLYDENEKVFEQEPLLACRDVDSKGIRSSWYHRIYARYGSFVFIDYYNTY